MRLKLKLPLAFAVTLGLLFLGGMFGILRLNASLDVYEHQVLATVAANKKVAQVDTQFASAIQEWKNVLLRGKDPKDLDKYWNFHVKDMQAVQDGLQQLQGMRMDADAKAVLNKLVPAIATVKLAYIKALDDYKAANMDPVAGDTAARGKDRESGILLKELMEKLSAAETATAEAASRDASRNTVVAIAVMLMATAIGLAIGFWLSRQITNPLGNAVGLAEQVAQGALNNRFDVQGQDEIADLLRSLQSMQSSLAQVVANVRRGSEGVASASAGEQGRGFAVVASEVRALAGRSAEAAKEIKSLISASVEKVEHGTALVDQAGTTMNEVVSSIKRVTDIMGEISAASHEQSQGVSQVEEAVSQMDQTTQQNAALVEEMAAAASSLKSQAQDLVQVVAAFQIDENRQLALR